MRTVVISLGGSIIIPDKIDVDFLKKFRELILDFVKKGNKFIIVCGGGKVCRDYLDSAKKITSVGSRDLDRLGVKVTEANAELMKCIFSGYAYKKVHSDYNKKINFDKILISAGFLPGTSTDFDAVMFAKNFRAGQIINLSNIDYVYDKNPKKFKDARPFKQISWKDFRKIVGNKWVAGLNVPFDPIASRKAQEFGLKVIILNGKNLQNLKNLLNGKKFTGTIIK